MLSEHDRRDHFRIDHPARRRNIHIVQRHVDATNVGGGPDNMVEITRRCEQSLYVVLTRDICDDSVESWRISAKPFASQREPFGRSTGNRHRCSPFQ